MFSERLCIIPARGGSKGLPGKNLRAFRGESLVRAALRKAVECDAFDHVVLSSDDDAILAEAEGLAAITLKRSSDTASDTATSEAVLAEVLNALDVREGTLAMIQCTTPLLTAEDIATAMALQMQNAPCSVVSGYAGSLHHWVLSADGRLTPVGYSGSLRRPRQGAEDRIFVENGGIYVTDTAAFLASGNRFNGRIIPYVMDEACSIDIDSEQDLRRAENA